MTQIDGEWTCVTRTPLGAQESVLTLRTEGSTFTGSNVGPLGSIDIKDGQIEGDTVLWTMDLRSPFPMKLKGRATVTGDKMEGVVDAGPLGKMPISGTRKA